MPTSTPAQSAFPEESYVSPSSTPRRTSMGDSTPGSTPGPSPFPTPPRPSLVPSMVPNLHLSRRLFNKPSPHLDAGFAALHTGGQEKHRGEAVRVALCAPDMAARIGWGAGGSAIDACVHYLTRVLQMTMLPPCSNFSRVHFTADNPGGNRKMPCLGIHADKLCVQQGISCGMMECRFLCCRRGFQNIYTKGHIIGYHVSKVMPFFSFRQVCPGFKVEDARTRLSDQAGKASPREMNSDFTFIDAV